MANEPSKKLINGCVSILGRYVENIHFPINLFQNENYFSLNCNNPILFSERQNDYQLMRIKGIDNIGIHFALKFEIEPISAKKFTYKLTDANLKFIHFNDNDLTVLFRSEFALNKDKIHAQPHWQFEPYIIKAISNEDINILIYLRNEKEKQLLEIDDEKKDLFNISKIHFAMISDWHLLNKDKKKSIVAELNEDSVVNWLDGCLSYTIEQIKNAQKVKQ
ncbi:hypothetical protein [Flavobacterium sp.]|uniref:hypothetical protein n=1 Tax=Flavobacterium sp. TaxID=239 RepID=UPI00286DF673|nr:hypothetical protein [Flavobacterium sp.]